MFPLSLALNLHVELAASLGSIGRSVSHFTRFVPTVRTRVVDRVRHNWCNSSGKCWHRDCVAWASSMKLQCELQYWHFSTFCEDTCRRCLRHSNMPLFFEHFIQFDVNAHCKCATIFAPKCATQLISKSHRGELLGASKWKSRSFVYSRGSDCRRLCNDSGKFHSQYPKALFWPFTGVAPILADSESTSEVGVTKVLLPAKMRLPLPSCPLGLDAWRGSQTSPETLWARCSP